MEKSANNNLFRYFSYFLIALWIFFYLIRFYNGAEKGYIRIHDCADHELVFVKQLLRSGALIPTSVKELEKKIPETMEGIPRYYHRTGLNFTFLFFSFLPTYYAYMVEDFVVHLIGIIAMFVFLRNYIIPERKEIAFFVALVFGFLNYQHIHYGITVSGMPLMFNAFLNILYKKAKWFDYVYIFLIYPFFSFFHGVVPYLGLVLAIVGIYHWRVKKFPFPFKYFMVLFLYATLSLLLEYPILYGMFWGEPSHRQEMKVIPIPFWGLVQIMLMGSDLFGFAHYSFVLFILLVLFIVSYKNKEHTVLQKQIIFLLISLGIIFVFLLLYQVVVKSDTFNLRKIIVLLSFIYFVLLAIALDFYITYQQKLGFFVQLLIMGFLVTFISTVLWKNHEIRGNLYNFISSNSPYPSFKELYVEEFWNSFKKKINPSEKNKIACIGYFPNIAQYHGLYTVGSYQNNYQLSYKHKFRKVIEKELSKNSLLQESFDKWGCFCAIVPAEYPLFTFHYVSKPSITAMKKVFLKNLEINTKFLKDSLNCNWIISTMEIQNYKDLNLSFAQEYETKFFSFKIYEVN